MTFRIAPAIREKTYNLIGLAGPSHSGKTFSALTLATGMANGAPIVCIDTENRRALHYASRFNFMHMPFDPPFSPDRYLEAIRAAVAITPAVVVVDSMSHEHEGEGGVLDLHESEMERMAGKDWAKRERIKFSAWIAPKQRHNALVNQLIRLPCHLICCFRAKDKLVLTKNERGRQEPVSIGWTPIVPDRFDYEMTDILILPPGAKGVPDLSAQSTKMNDEHRAFFRDGEAITEDMGRQLRAWAEGGAPQPAKKQTAGEWLDALKARLDAASSAEAVTAIRGEGEVQTALAKFPAAPKKRLEEMLRLAEERFEPAGDDVFGGERMET